MIKKRMKELIKTPVKDLFRKFLVFFLKQQVSEMNAACLRLVLGKRIKILWFMVCLPFSPANKQKTKKLFSVFEDQGIIYRHLARTGKGSNLADFQILSGYLRSGRELKTSLAGFLPEKTIDTKRAVKKESHTPVQLNNTGSYPELAVLLFRMSKKDVLAVEKEMSTRFSFGEALKPMLFYCRADENYPAGELSGVNNYPMEVNALPGAFNRVCEDPAISDDTLILFNFSDGSVIANQLTAITGSDASGADLVVLRSNSILHQPAEMRNPERALSFAVTKSLLNKVAHFPYAEHPMALLLGLWHLASQSGRVEVIDYEPYCPVQGNLQHTPLSEAVHIDRLTTRIISEALLRYDSVAFSGLIYDLPYYKNSLPLSIEEEDKSINFSGILPENNSFDVLVVTDYRIRGGGVKSVLEEAKIMKEVGLRVAVMHLDAITLHQLKIAFTPDVFSELSNLNIPLVNGLSQVKADLTVVRYPPALVAIPEGVPVIDTRQAVIVINQPPKRMFSEQGFYKPEDSDQNAKELFAVEPQWWPNGPGARKAMEDYSGRLHLSDQDWLNVINSFADDAEVEARVNRLKDGNRSISIGRHTRDVINKWPSTAQAILLCYPDDDMFSVKILGGARWPRRIMKRIPDNWEVWDYGEIDVQEYLGKLDVFVFFPHEERIESFARCIVEAMAAGIPVLLPERFRGEYGQSPIYCQIDEVTTIISDFKKDIKKYKEKCFETREEAMEIFGPECLLSRLRNLGLRI